MSISKIDFDDELFSNKDNTKIVQNSEISSIRKISENCKPLPAAIHVVGAPDDKLIYGDDEHQTIGGSDEIVIVTSRDVTDFIVTGDDETRGHTKGTSDMVISGEITGEFYNVHINKYDLRTQAEGATVDHKTDNEVVQFWLEHTVGLPQYYNLLIENGYESLDSVKEIDGRDQLKEIGIDLREHQTKLLSEIARLKLIEDKENINEFLLRQMSEGNVNDGKGE